MFIFQESNLSTDNGGRRLVFATDEVGAALVHDVLTAAGLDYVGSGLVTCPLEMKASDHPKAPIFRCSLPINDDGYCEWGHYYFEANEHKLPKHQQKHESTQS